MCCCRCTHQTSTTDCRLPRSPNWVTGKPHPLTLFTSYHAGTDLTSTARTLSEQQFSGGFYCLIWSLIWLLMQGLSVGRFPSSGLCGATPPRHQRADLPRPQGAADADPRLLLARPLHRPALRVHRRCGRYRAHLRYVATALMYATGCISTCCM